MNKFVYVNIYVYFWVMKQCLHCKKEFQEQKETAKYCSTSCRVMFNRNKPKEKKAFTTESKLEVMCNAVMDMLTDIKFSKTTPNSFDAEKINHIRYDEPLQWEEPKLQGKSVSQHLKEIADLETPYEYQQKTVEIENDLTLSSKDRKDLLLNIKLPKN